MTEARPPEAGAEAWTARVGRRLAGLAGARVVAQVLGLVWFVVAARALSPSDLGVLSGALALMVVLGGLADLGTTRTVVRHIAGDARLLWPTLRRALVLRVGAGIIVGAAAVALLWALSVDLPAGAVALAAWIAVASGANELSYASLRAVGQVRPEMALLVLERVLFTAAACTALALGAGPFVPLALYGVTNSISAVVATARAHKLSAAHRTASPPPSTPLLLDTEGRHTAVASTLVIIGPRVGAVVLVLLATPTAVGSFAVAQKPTEALSLLAVAMLTPMLAMLRAHTLRNDRDGAVLAGSRLTSAVLVLVVPVLAWLIVDRDGVLELLFGSADRPGAAIAIALLAVAALGFILRSLGELLLLADERASRYVVAVGVGTAVTLATAIALVPSRGTLGAAWATLAGEAVALSLVVIALPRLRRRAALVPFARPLLLAALVTLALVTARPAGARVGLAVAAAGSAVGVGLARGLLRGLDTTPALSR